MRFLYSTRSTLRFTINHSKGDDFPTIRVVALLRLVHCICAGLRRVCAPARTGSNRQYSHFRPNLSAPVGLCCTEAAPVAPGTSICSAVTRTQLPRRGFCVYFLPASSARRSRAGNVPPYYIWCLLCNFFYI